MTLRSWINGLALRKFSWDDLICNASTIDGRDGVTDCTIGFAKFKTGQRGGLTNTWHHVKNPDARNCFVHVGIRTNTDERRRGSIRRTTLADLERELGIHNELLPRDLYFRRLGDSNFVVSPEGNGIDCHRHYEALMMGAVPIVEDSALVREKYKGCPMIFTQDQYKSLSEESLHRQYQELLDQEFDFSALFLSSYSAKTQREIMTRSLYWKRKISARVPAKI